MASEDYVEEKVKNPLDSLPKSSMNLDACKRLFNDHKLTDKKFFTTEFETMFDNEGFSLYKSSYKYNEDFEGRPDFVNNNFMRGIVQSMDNSRKYVFATLLMFGENKKRELVGYWIMRGSQPITEVFNNLLEDNNWEKLEFNKETLSLYDQAFYEEKINDKQPLNRTIVL